MAERSPLWQAVNALLVSVAALAVILFSAWFMDRADAALGHGPLPSTLPLGEAYIITFLAVVFGFLPAAAMMLGVRQAKYFSPRFAWLVYGIVCIPLLLLLAVPLQRHGHEGFLNLPPFLLGIPGRAVVAVALGALFFSAVDMGRLVQWFMNWMPKIHRRPRQTTGTTVQGLPGRFTPSAWRALSNMQEEAQRFEHAYMGTEHLLLGMLRDTRSQGVRVIINLGADPAAIKTQLEGVIGRRGSLYTGASGMTRRSQRVIESAARFGRTSGQRTISTGHLLHALVEDPEDMAGQLLHGSGVTVERVAGELRHLGPEED